MAADLRSKIVESGARQQIIQNGLAVAVGTTAPLLQANSERWAIIFAVVAGGPIDLSPVPFQVPIYRLNNGDHQLLYFAREGALTQQQWQGFSPTANTSINVTEIILLG